MAENNGGYNVLKFGHTDKRVYDTLTSEHPIDLVRYQLANCYMGRAGLINSGGASAGETDTAESVRTAVINKRAGGMGLIMGRKAFKKSMRDGVALINAVRMFICRRISPSPDGQRDDAASSRLSLHLLKPFAVLLGDGRNGKIISCRWWRIAFSAPSGS